MIFTPRFMQRFEVSMNILIVLNAVAFGLLTDPSLAHLHRALEWFCDVSIVVFVVELAVRIYYYKKQFFVGPNRGWNYFDGTIVLLSCAASVPFLASFRVFRLFRIFRQLNILRIIPSARRLRIIIEAIYVSLPGVLWTGVLYSIVIYTYALVGTEFFGTRFPEWFGTAWRSLYTLFQIMTLESWSMGISRPVMEAFSGAWVYFVSYVVISAFVILNIIVALVVNSLSEVTARAEREEAEADRKNQKQDPDTLPGLDVVRTLDTLEAELARLRTLLEQKEKK